MNYYCQSDIKLWCHTYLALLAYIPWKGSYHEMFRKRRTPTNNRSQQIHKILWLLYPPIVFVCLGVCYIMYVACNNNILYVLGFQKRKLCGTIVPPLGIQGLSFVVLKLCLNFEYAFLIKLWIAKRDSYKSHFPFCPSQVLLL